MCVTLEGNLFVTNSILLGIPHFGLPVLTHMVGFTLESLLSSL